MNEPQDNPALSPSLLPELLPIFPLSGVVLLPHGKLPLNIFEARYLSLVEEALGKGRMIGLIQPSDEGTDSHPSLYQVGCAGRIISFSETDDGRFLINLLGVCRFRVAKELPERRGYRIVKPDWEDFLADMGPFENPDYDRDRLTNILRTYFKTHGVMADWGVVQNTASEELVSSLAMICPLPPNEKQALLEAPSLHARAELLISLLEMACLHQDEGEVFRH